MIPTIKIPRAEQNELQKQIHVNEGEVEFEK